MKTYGKVQHGRRTDTDAMGYKIDVEPHVAIMLKRWFPRAQQAGSGSIFLDDTPEVSRELEFMLIRYPLVMDDDVRRHITREADKDRHREETMLAILDGTHERAVVRGWQEPAREPRDYQTVGADLAWVQKGMLLGDDVGLGKTQTGTMLFRDPDTLPAVVVTLTHLPKQWQREVNAILPNLKTHIVTKTKPYPVDADVLIMSYSKLDGWRDYLAGTARSIVFDEVQELRRGSSAKYSAALHIARKAEWRLGLSATPVYNYGGETHTIFEVLAPGALGSRAEFVREWGGFDYCNDNIRIRDAAALGSFLRGQGLMLRRTRGEVGRDIPEPFVMRQEVPARAEVFEQVKNDLRGIAALLTSKETDAREKWRITGDLDWKLRHATGVAKARGVAEFVRLLLESEEKVVLYGWHHDVYDIWRHHLAEHGVSQYTGSESLAQKDRARDMFVKGPHRVMMMSLRAGAGLDGLQYSGCKTVVFGELDWSPQIHEQAIGRVARDGQEQEVLAAYCVTNSGSDPVIAERLAIKAQQSELIRNPNADQTKFANTLGVENAGKMQTLLDAVRSL